MSTSTKTVETLANRDYKWGFVSDIEADTLPPGLNEDVIRLISAKKAEPEFMLQWRLRAYRHWEKLERQAGEPKWANVTYPPIDYQKIVYYSAPNGRAKGPRAWRRSIPSCSRRSRSSGFLSLSRSAWPASRSTRSSTASRWPRRSKRSWPISASSSARSPRR